MTTNLKYFFFIFLSFACFFNKAQTLNLPIVKANTQLYKGHIYLYGLSDQAKKNKLIIYKVNFKLSKTDSLVIDLGKSTSADFLQITSDTLHDFLNIYLQKKDKKVVQVLRFNKKFELIATIDDVDIARLNSISAFEREIFYDKLNVYTIRSATDTSGKQFYLNKYTVKSELNNFEYDKVWQFPFERKNVNSAHIVFADKLIVLLYVNVIDGGRRGQWLLKINTNTGLLIKGTRINDKGDNNFFSYGKILMDTANKQIYLQGQKFTEAELNQKDNKINLCSKPNVNIYLASIDSAGDLISRDEFKIPIVEAKGVTNKTPINYLLRTNKILKTNEGEFLIEADVFKGINNQFCYTYCNSNMIKLMSADGQLSLEKNTINSNPLVEKYFLNNDKLDMNGKLCIDSITDFEKLFYNTLTFNVKLDFKLDEAKNPIWLLKKTDIKKNIENFSSLSPVKKIYQITKLEEVNKTENPGFMNVSKNQVIISKQTLLDRFQLQIFNW